MIKRYIIYIGISLLFIFNSAMAESIAVDVPAMNNMAVGEPIEIDSPNGSITQISTSIMSSKSQVLSFYRKNLANLNWKKVNNNTYSRRGETLIISFGEKDANGLSVDFTIITPFE